MNKIILILIALLIPATTFAAFPASWQATSTTQGWIMPSLINGLLQTIVGNNFIATSSTASTFPYASTTYLTVSQDAVIGNAISPQLNAFGTKNYELQILGSINDVVGQAIYNINTGTSAAAGIFFQNSNSPLGGIGALQKYYGGIAFGGGNWNGVPLGFGALAANDLAAYSTDGNLILGSATSSPSGNVGKINMFVGAGSFSGGTPDFTIIAGPNNTGPFVGIGTSTPEERLEVAGNIRLATGANRTISVGSATSTAGFNLTLMTNAGVGNSGVGGAIINSTGAGGSRTTSGTASAGGGISYTFGTGGSALISGSSNIGGAGGGMVVTGGTGGKALNSTGFQAAGTGGALSFTGGAGAFLDSVTGSIPSNGSGGAVSFTGGAGGSGVTSVTVGGNGGATNLIAGNAGAGGLGRNGGIGGSTVIGTGAGGASSQVGGGNNIGGNGGAQTVTTASGGAGQNAQGNNTGGNGGAMNYTAGAGGSGSTGSVSTGGSGGAITFTGGGGGAGFSGTTTNIAGNGGTLSFVGGNAGTLNIGGTGGSGGNVSFTGGSPTLSATSTANGGSIFLIGGLSSPLGNAGNIVLGVNSSGAVRGNVGIGTSTPTALLAIGNHALFSGTTTDMFLIASSTSSATTTHFVVKNTGNVGIGTTSPYRSLSVENNAVFGADVLASFFTSTSTTSFNRFPLLSIPNEASLGGLYGDDIGGTKRVIFAVGNTAMASNSTRIRSAGGGISFENFATNTILSILDNGNVGIATTTGSAKLTLASGSSINCPQVILATSTSMTVDFNGGCNQLVRMGTAATSIAFSNGQPGQKIELEVCNPTTTAGTLTFTGAISYRGGIAPSNTTTANQCDVYSWTATYATSTTKYRLTGMASGFQ